MKVESRFLTMVPFTQNRLIHFQELESMLRKKFLQKGAGSFRDLQNKLYKEARRKKMDD